MRLVNEEPIDGAHDCLVAFVHPSATGGILLELSEKKKTLALSSAVVSATGGAGRSTSRTSRPTIAKNRSA